nr:sensor histidine kinase [Microbacterium esteraromaticum]
MAELQDELARTQRDAGAARERTRLARDLHDTIAQELSSVSLLARGGDADRMPQIDALAQHSLTELRRIVAALAPAELEGTALAGALQRLLDALAADTGIRTELDVDEAPPALPTSVEVTLLRIAQSALANVRQHSAAELVRVVLAGEGDRAVLQISDDGRGFDTTALEVRTRSYGLIAMRSRLRELGGELRIDSAPGEGTTVRAEVGR